MNPVQCTMTLLIDVFCPFNAVILLAFFSAMLMAVGFVIRPLHFKNVLLSVFMIIMAYILFYLNIIYSKKIYDYPHLLLTNLPCLLVMGPVLYFYTLSIINDKESLQIRDSIHFLPVLIIVAVLFPSYILPAQTKSRMLYESSFVKPNVFYIIIEGIVIFHMMIYILFSIYKINKPLKIKDPMSDKIKLFIVPLGACVIVSIFAIFYNTVHTEVTVLKLINFIIAMVVLGIYFLSHRYPYLMLYGIVPVRNKTYMKSHLSKLNISNLKNQLVTLMKEEKMYCDEDLTLTRLSSALEITPHQLSQFLNQHFDKNFNNFINEYRINEAKEFLVREPERGLVSIAFAVGFNSYSAFASAFKKETNLAPAEYRKNNVPGM